MGRTFEIVGGLFAALVLGSGLRRRQARAGEGARDEPVGGLQGHVRGRAGAGEAEARRDRLEGDGRLGDERVEDRRRRRGDRSSDEEVRRQEAPEGDREEDAEGLTAEEIMLDGGMTRV